MVTDLTNRVVLEFEDVVSTNYRPEEMEQGLLERSMYQKIIPLNSKIRHKVDLVVKDLNSGKVGAISKGLVPPAPSSRPAGSQFSGPGGVYPDAGQGPRTGSDVCPGRCQGEAEY